MSHNKLLTNLTCATRTKEYWPAVVFARTSPHSVCVLPRPWANISRNIGPILEYFSGKQMKICFRGEKAESSFVSRKFKERESLPDAAGVVTSWPRFVGKFGRIGMKLFSKTAGLDKKKQNKTKQNKTEENKRKQTRKVKQKMQKNNSKNNKKIIDQKQQTFSAFLIPERLHLL